MIQLFGTQYNAKALSYTFPKPYNPKTASAHYRDDVEKSISSRGRAYKLLAKNTSQSLSKFSKYRKIPPKREIKYPSPRKSLSSANFDGFIAHNANVM